MTRRYIVRTFGCQMNEHDSERIAGLLEADGMEQANTIDEADVVVLNTCCIRENADNKLYGQLGQLKSIKAERPDLEVAVGGCLAQKDRDLIQQRAGHVDVVFGTHNVHRAAALLHEARRRGPITEIWNDPPDDIELFPSSLPVRRETDFGAWVTIQMGCDNACAFCIVPAVRGPEVSRPFGDIVGEVERLARDGVVEVTLLGQNVNSYGRDLTTARRASARTDDAFVVGPQWASAATKRARPVFADLLAAVASVEGIRRVRYTSPHPKDLRAETIEAMAAHDAICHHLHLPLQSGSDRILKLMHRGYTAQRYLERLVAARDAMPDLAVTTDIIVGFPGETEADFERTLEVVAEAGYDSAYTFIFSPRPGTEAAVCTELFVPKDVSAERFERLRVVVERSALAKHRACIGQVEEVIVEGPSKKDPTRTTGRTGHNKLVHFAPGPAPLRRGCFADVRIVGAGPHHLRGELVAVTAEPTHRTRIPVLSA
ncbi:MAG: tRNA (N6-isopentenyl adenosine(37)-C2)-methylthiotransferase MiaB [Actinobacteria bacterium]|nr:tRNA (N6-isopentenyl adenosine(37)-C2)-methylthiotransferase MiaB [Actinomycetota bacterium]